MHLRFTGPIVRVAGAAALTAALLPGFAGTASAATSTTKTVSVGGTLAPHPISLTATVTNSTPSYMTGKVTLKAGVTYSYTLGFFNSAAPSPYNTSAVWVDAEWIESHEIKPQGGSYTWVCGLYPLPTNSTYNSNCTLSGPNDSYTFVMLTSYKAPKASYLVNWQLSFVETSRVRGTTQSSRTSYDYGQCTYGAAEQIRAHYAYYPPQWHNAMKWFDNANTYKWSTSWYPQSNSVVVFQPGVYGAPKAADGGVGHVGWVDGIEFRSDGGIYLHTTEMNLYKAIKGSYHHRILKDQGTKTTLPQMSYILPAH